MSLNIINSIDKFAKLMPIRINEVPLQFNESKHLALDSTKSKNNLKWHSILDIDSTVDYTTDWYLSYLQNKVDMHNKLVDLYQTEIGIGEDDD